MSDSLHFRRIKALISKSYTIVPTFSMVITFFSFFMGNYYVISFPGRWFWVIAVAISLGRWGIEAGITKRGQYADPFMHQCVSNQNGVFYYFSNRKDLEERTIVEIRRVHNGVTCPCVLAYIDSQDVKNMKEMLVIPFAYYINDKYQRSVAKKNFKVSKKRVHEYVLTTVTLKKETLDKIC